MWFSSTFKVFIFKCIINAHGLKGKEIHSGPNLVLMYLIFRIFVCIEAKKSLAAESDNIVHTTLCRTGNTIAGGLLSGISHSAAVWIEPSWIFLAALVLILDFKAFVLTRVWQINLWVLGWFSGGREGKRQKLWILHHVEIIGKESSSMRKRCVEKSQKGLHLVWFGLVSPFPHNVSCFCKKLQIYSFLSHNFACTGVHHDRQ